MNNIKIARVVTVPIAFSHLKGFISFLTKKANVQVDLISSDGQCRKNLEQEFGIDLKVLSISRDISLINDLKSLFNLFIFFKTNKYTIIHSSTPKAGLLCAIVGFFFPKVVCIHTFTGQRWVNVKKPLKILLKLLDRLVIFLNSQCYADSHSQIDFLVSERVAKRGELICINKGSYGGVDTKRFKREKYPSARKELLVDIEGEAEDFLFLYVGRITKSKGIEELVNSFVLAQKDQSNIRLVLVGPYESSLDGINFEIEQLIKNHENIHAVGFKINPEFYFSACDAFCLPSYREGFGTVVLEAASCRMMTIGTRIPGLTDSIIDNETGLLVEKYNITELKEAMLLVANDSELRDRLASNALDRVQKDFDSDLLAQLQWEEYERLLKKHS